MSLIRNIAGFLQTTGHGTLWNGSTGDLFVDEMSANPADALMMAPLTSSPPDFYLNTRTLEFEIWCRNKSTKTGHDKLENIFLLLHRYHHLILGDYEIYFIGASGDIEYLDNDIEGRSLHKQNYRAIYIDNRTVS